MTSPLPALDDNSEDTSVSFVDLQNFENELHDSGIYSYLTKDIVNKYYELCSSKSLILHHRVAAKHPQLTVASIIAETVKVSNAIRTSNTGIPKDEFEEMENTLSAFEKLGMEVGFLKKRVNLLAGLASKSRRIHAKRQRLEMKIRRNDLNWIQKATASWNPADAANIRSPEAGTPVHCDDNYQDSIATPLSPEKEEKAKRMMEARCSNTWFETEGRSRCYDNSLKEMTNPLPSIVYDNSEETNSLSKCFIDFQSFEIELHDSGIYLYLTKDLVNKYYELCRSQNLVLHHRVAVKHPQLTVASTIAETFEIANAIRTWNRGISKDEFEEMENTLSAFEMLGMEVGFLCRRLSRLAGLASKSRTTTRIINRHDRKIKRLQAKLERNDQIIAQEATAPW